MYASNILVFLFLPPSGFWLLALVSKSQGPVNTSSSLPPAATHTSPTLFFHFRLCRVRDPPAPGDFHLDLRVPFFSYFSTPLPPLAPLYIKRKMKKKRRTPENTEVRVTYTGFE
ncbi:CPG_1a_G0017010.mRNA.1.CDS.1 [Saccharomyces cerevisiae]|nr:CPG_1a_G0017010.mRNA.1.CDS.1 [Saccharomyces cerevisiae]CAI7276054.1 CPG_1a_G0017010.mRNA.1.CDS.1 [Saccharomyces cerevisiae]